jgi:hypothetical protein
MMRFDIKIMYKWVSPSMLYVGFTLVIWVAGGRKKGLSLANASTHDKCEYGSINAGYAVNVAGGTIDL